MRDPESALRITDYALQTMLEQLTEFTNRIQTQDERLAHLRRFL